MPARRARQKGFSLIELVVVGAIILALAAFTVPQVMRSARLYKLSSATGELSNFVQRTRLEAIRRNGTVTTRAVQQGGGWLVWLDLNDNGRLDGPESALSIGGGLGFLGQAEVPGSDSMGYGNTRQPQGSISFDARGAVDFGGNPPAVLVIYLGYREQTDLGYRAISILPSGKTKIWQAQNGGQWTGLGHAY